MNKLTNLSRSIKESVVMITGAGSGMGEATARLFADQGAITIVTDINKKNADSVAIEINNSGGKSVSHYLDVGDKENIAETVREVITKFEKLEHYALGTGDNEITSKKVKDAITLMKVTSLLFFGIVSIPIILLISFMELILFA